jgi:hypothetical protein
MTPDQQHCWDVLRADPQRLCHTYAQELEKIKNKRQFNRRADQYLDFMMSNFSTEGVLRTVKTWLSVYRLPLDPTALSTFDRFNSNYHHIISQRPSWITPYERN